mmetsp:Transcript_21548/g.59780  ORF Transcript_21548/g.59780 Transcript_21548/m.59780 type:complete len:101 (+) Transcript_21548:204-506(+)
MRSAGRRRRGSSFGCRLVWAHEARRRPRRASAGQRTLKQFGEAQLPAREAAELVSSVFPAAYEWLVKRWFGPGAITEGVIHWRVLPQDTRRGALKLPDKP